MNTFKYVWLHMPSNKSGERTITARITKQEFYDMLVKWNSQRNWIYTPVQ